MKKQSRERFRPGIFTRYGIFTILVLAAAGCQSPKDYREKTEQRALEIITQKQQEALGQAEPFDIERPSDILRRRLLVDQDLTLSGPASLGTDQLTPIDHWPEKNDPQLLPKQDLTDPASAPIRLTLIQALEVGARNSFDYQSRKESVFQSALDLDLERNEFRNIFVGQLESAISTDSGGNRTVSGTEQTADFGMSRQLTSGAAISTAIAIDLANLLTMNHASSMGLAGDATISIPLLRGSGKHIVTEPLTQAERNVVYAIWQFERFKKQFAVNVASNYLSVLRQIDALKNSREDYRSRIASVRRSRRQADAGRLQEIEVDLAVQNELRARQRWISATAQYHSQLDSFKMLLGLPPDAEIELAPNELEQLNASYMKIIEDLALQTELTQEQSTPPADAEIILTEPSMENGGPLEMDSTTAVKLALDNRLDLRVAQGQVCDAQRAVVVSADALGAELTFFGSAAIGGRRSVASAGSDDANLHPNEGAYSGLLTLDLPLERTHEAVLYRNSFIQLEQAVRDVQSLEDEIKQDIRNELRDMLETRENLYIQAQSVQVAQKRVKSVNLFLEAGRAQIRDLVEAQDALLSAQNSLTSAVVDYRIAELQIQRDMGLLKVNEKGLWKEYSPQR